MEALGGDRKWQDRFLGQHAAVFYYWALVLCFILAPKWSYKFSEMLESAPPAPPLAPFPPACGPVTLTACLCCISAPWLPSRRLPRGSLTCRRPPCLRRSTYTPRNPACIPPDAWTPVLWTAGGTMLPAWRQQRWQL